MTFITKSEFKQKKSINSFALSLGLFLILLTSNTLLAQIDPLLSNLDATNINKDLQRHLNKRIKDANSPIAGIAVSEIATGKIIAMAEGRNPIDWGKSAHTNIYPFFPTASLYKTVVASAAIEELNIDPDMKMNLWSGCQFVQSSGTWMRDTYRSKQHQLSFKKAYGKSCNNFFAKLIVEKIGLNIVTDYTKRFGWYSPLQTDVTDQTPNIFLPEAISSNSQSIGKFGAGFGKVYTSVLHQLWIINTIGNKGMGQKLRLYKNTSQSSQTQVIQSSTAEKMLELMTSTFNGGTASSSARKRKYRSFRKLVGGKSGTLSGTNPKGINSWFAGLYPIDNPKYAITAVTVLEDKWHFKGADLFSEAVWGIRQYVENPNKNVAQEESTKSKF